VERLNEEIPDYSRRLRVKPGITGLAQIRTGYDHTVRDVRRKVRLDLLYIRRMCWWVDVVILFGTMATVTGLMKERRVKRGEKQTEDREDLCSVGLTRETDS
jgi:lipopolysaccharide/colanic/teichoic acid biosynthesis glycosyltransferase